MDTIKLVEFHSPFSRDRDAKILDYKGESLLELKNKYFGKNTEIAISVNGALIPDYMLEVTYLRPNDCMTFAPIIEGDDTLRTIAGIVLAIVAIAAPYLAPASWGLIGVSGGLTLAGALVSAGVMLIGGLLINSLLPVNNPDIESVDTSTSNLYSWSPKTVQKQGVAIPKIYGKTSVTGNIINTYIESLNNDQFLNILLSLGYGPIKQFEEFYINDQPIGYINGVTLETRLGKINQSLLSGFDNTKVEYTKNVELTYETVYTMETTGDAFDELEVEISFPYGLYHSNDAGGLDNIGVEYEIQIAPAGSGDWQNITSRVGDIVIAEGYWSRGYEIGGYLETGNYGYNYDGSATVGQGNVSWGGSFTGV